MAKKASVKGRELLKLKEKFPDFNYLNYDQSIRENLNFYNIEIEDSKKKKEWAIAYWKSQGKNVTGLARFNDGYFLTVGAVAHMVLYREIELSDLHLAYLEKKYQDFISVLPTDEEKKVNIEEPTKLKNEKDEEACRTHIGEFLNGVDMFIRGESFDGKQYLIRNSVKPVHTKRISDELKKILREVKLAISGKDSDLVEAYGFFTKRKLTKYAEYIQSLIDSCEVASAITKAARKPRATKVKTPTELVKNVKWLAEDATSKLKSEHPSKIINASEVWLYNAKNRRLFRYVALSGMKLSVKGMTIINMDAEKSGGKIIRKPEKQLEGIQSMTSRPLNKLYNDIRSTESSAAGRLNDDTVIVKCFN